MMEVMMTVAQTEEEYDMTLETDVEFKGNYVTYYTGTSAPSNSLGVNGDIYVKVNS